MALKTAFTELLSIEHPVVCAPMTPDAGGALAAAVSNAGGLGLIGGGTGGVQKICNSGGPPDTERHEREISVVVGQTTKPWGIGFLTWGLTQEVLERALSHRPAAVLLNFGDASPFAELVHRAGSVLIVGVTDLNEARQALSAGADVIVAQGGEAGGHGGRRATLPFVPAVVDLAGSTPVLAAGGIADGRGLAAALVLGASGAMLGTRFEASSEAQLAPWAKRSIVEGRAEDTERHQVWDVAEGGYWPRTWSERTLRNPFFEKWRGREDELEADTVSREAYQHASDNGDRSVSFVFAGEAIDLITDIVPAAELVEAIVSQAEMALSTAGRPQH